MRLCALRARLQPSESGSNAISHKELNAIAPESLYKDTRSICETRGARIWESNIVRPQPAILRESASSSTEEHSGDDKINHQVEKMKHMSRAGMGVQKHGLASIVEIAEETDDIASCSICLEDFTEEVIVRQTRCGHVFHSHCLTQWLERPARRCPLCQGDLGLQEGLSVGV